MVYGRWFSKCCIGQVFLSFFSCEERFGQFSELPLTYKNALYGFLRDFLACHQIGVRFLGDAPQNFDSVRFFLFFLAYR